MTRTPKSPTPAPGSGDFSCELTDQSPEDGATMSKKQDFVASWTVKNTGASAWDKTSVDFDYVSGAKLTALKAADLPKNVAADASITLTLSMQAPSSAATYKTAWTLTHGKDSFCRLTLTIVVK